MKIERMNKGDWGKILAFFDQSQKMDSPLKDLNL